MKNFSKFIKEEITIKGNSGIPGESGNNKNSEKQYLSDVERRARQRLGVPREENPMIEPPIQTMSIVQELNELMQKSMGFIRGNEKELEDLAKRIILSEYGSILENVDLDIKIIKPEDVKDFMDEECEDCQLPSYQLLTDPEIKKEVDKRKILNNITQGEAKNTKRILAMPEVKDELISILGDKNGKEAHRVWTRITELADKLDWLIPVYIKADMMERAPQGMAGACSVKWPGKKSDEESEDLSGKVLKDLENGDIDDNNEDLKDLLSNGNPIIKARGVDFPMLLHETVKGIYELIAAAGIPEDKRTAELVILNTSSFSDEAEEFRFGPEIAADIRDFVNKTKKNIDNYTNVREKFCGKLAAMPAEQFLLLVKNILSDAPSARTKVDEIIQSIMDEEDNYKRELAEYEAAAKLGEFDQDEDDERSEFEQEDPDENPVNKKPYEKMTQSEIQQEIDKAVEEENYELAGELTRKFLKGEAKMIWETELRRINEGHFSIHKKNN
jgi:hypothetical protein